MAEGSAVVPRVRALAPGLLRVDGPGGPARVCLDHCCTSSGSLVTGSAPPASSPLPTGSHTGRTADRSDPSGSLSVISVSILALAASTASSVATLALAVTEIRDRRRVRRQGPRSPATVALAQEALLTTARYRTWLTGHSEARAPPVPATRHDRGGPRWTTRRCRRGCASLLLAQHGAGVVARPRERLASRPKRARPARELALSHPPRSERLDCAWAARCAWPVWPSSRATRDNLAHAQSGRGSANACGHHRSPASCWAPADEQRRR